jgi:hypothetical protein
LGENKYKLELIDYSVKIEIPKDDLKDKYHIDLLTTFPSIEEAYRGRFEQKKESTSTGLEFLSD